MIPDISSQAPVAAEISWQEAPPHEVSPLVASLLQDLNLCTASLIASIPDGIKTIPMMEKLNEKLLLDYDSKNQTFTHQGVSYKVLKGSNKEISKSPVVSIGSEPSGREIISLDPQNSPLLEAKYQELLAYLKDEFNENTSLPLLLETISTFVREEIFLNELCTEKNTEQLMQRWQRAKERKIEDFAVTKDKKLIPVIPIDEYIQHRVGVCRHQALVTAYIFDRLIKEEQPFLPSGYAFHVRDVVQIGDLEGGHAWNLYVSGKETWHVDALWGLVKNITNPDDLNYLKQAYGEETISRVLARFVP